MASYEDIGPRMQTDVSSRHCVLFVSRYLTICISPYEQHREGGGVTVGKGWDEGNLH